MVQEKIHIIPDTLINRNQESKSTISHRSRYLGHSTPCIPIHLEAALGNKRASGQDQACQNWRQGPCQTWWTCLPKWLLQLHGWKMRPKPTTQLICRASQRGHHFALAIWEKKKRLKGTKIQSKPSTHPFLFLPNPWDRWRSLQFGQCRRFRQLPKRPVQVLWAFVHVSDFPQPNETQNSRFGPWLPLQPSGA